MLPILFEVKEGRLQSPAKWRENKMREMRIFRCDQDSFYWEFAVFYLRRALCTEKESKTVANLHHLCTNSKAVQKKMKKKTERAIPLRLLPIEWLCINKLMFVEASKHNDFKRLFCRSAHSSSLFWSDYLCRKPNKRRHLFALHP